MDKQTDTDDDVTRRYQSMANKLVTMVNGYAVDRNRLRGLVLFEERKGEKNTRPISKVNGYDRPEIELILIRRDRCMKLEAAIVTAELAIASAKRQIDEGQTEWIEALTRALGDLARLEAQRQRHFDMIESRLEALSHEMVNQESLMAKLSANAAQLAQKAAEHSDKMELAHKAASVPSSLELKQRLALRYNIPVEQVESFMLAKDAEIANG